MSPVFDTLSNNGFHPVVRISQFIAESLMSLTFDDWNDALFERVVEARGQSDLPLILFVDRSTLQEITGDLDASDAVKSFTRAYAGRYSPGRPFDPNTVGTAGWLEGGAAGIPPFFAALCMSVLAVTEPSEDQGRGVYMTQNLLLGLPKSTTPPGKYDRDVPFLWRLWNAWLEGRGLPYGTPTASTNPHWKYQGWARSQGKIRDRDRESLFDFFEYSNASGSEDAVLLGAELKNWLRFHGSSHPGLSQLVADPQQYDLIISMLPRFRSNWIRKAQLQGRRWAPVQLMVLEEAQSLDLIVNLGESDWLRGETIKTDFQDSELVSANDQLVFLTGKGKNHNVLEGRQFELSDSIRARWSASPVILLQTWDFEARVEVRHAVWKVEYSALVRSDDTASVVEIMRAYGAAPERIGEFAAGWDLISPIVYDAARLGTTNGAPPAYVPAIAEAPELSGGLPLGRGALYLERGEPDVVVPSASGGITVCVDDRPFHHIDPSDGPTLVRLRDAFLPPGEHRVSIGDHTLVFVSAAPERIHHTGWRDFRTGPGRGLSGAFDSDPLCVDLRQSPSLELVVVANDTAIVGIDTTTIPNPRWMTAARISPTTRADLAALVPRGLTGKVAYLAFRQSKSSRWNIVDVPRDSRFFGTLPTQQVEVTFGGIVASERAKWLNARDPAKFSEMFLAARTKRKPVGQIATHSLPSAVVPRLDILSEPESYENPYDEFLAWISELEAGTSSLSRAEDVWSWLTTVHSSLQPQSSFGTMLRKLKSLDHLDIDWRQRKIYLRRSTLTELPNSMGLVSFIGSRPDRVIEALVGGATDDHDPFLASLAQHVVVKRLRLEQSGSPVSPDPIYLELERYPALQDDLHALGFVWATARQDPTYSLDAVIADALDWPNSWAADRETLKLNHWEYFSWETPTTQSDLGGVGKYSAASGPVFTYKGTNGAREKVVDLETSKWLWARDNWPEGLISYRPRTGLMLIPSVLSLPLALERAVVGRSSLLPRRIRHIRPQPSSPLTSYFAYENSNLASAENIARALGLPNAEIVSTTDLLCDV
jgi:hypothetical protein